MHVCILNSYFESFIFICLRVLPILITSIHGDKHKQCVTSLLVPVLINKETRKQYNTNLTIIKSSSHSFINFEKNYRGCNIFIKHTYTDLCYDSIKVNILFLLYCNTTCTSMILLFGFLNGDTVIFLFLKCIFPKE